MANGHGGDRKDRNSFNAVYFRTLRNLSHCLGKAQQKGEGASMGKRGVGMGPEGMQGWRVGEIKNNTQIWDDTIVSSPVGTGKPHPCVDVQPGQATTQAALRSTLGVICGTWKTSNATD